MEFIDLRAQQLRIRDGIERAIRKVLEHGNYIMGPEVAELERQLCTFTGAKHCVSCANGTDALLMALMAEGTGPGDAVFLPSFTFVATAEAPALLGATPVFVDVDPEYFLMDLKSLQDAVAAASKLGLRPKAVIPVDLFGQPADYAAINRYARGLGLLVIADAAQSFGAESAGRKVGTLAPITTTSFFPAKPLGCYGDGGAIFTDDDETADVLRSLRMHGKGRDKYDNVRIGLNGRLDTLQAAILIEKLKIFPDEIARRDAVAERYGRLLDGAVQIPRVRTGATSVWAQYTVCSPDRDRFTRQCAAAGIPTAVYYPVPLHRQTGYADCPASPSGLHVSEELSRRVFSLPMHPYLSAEDQDLIASQLCEQADEVAAR